METTNKTWGIFIGVIAVIAGVVIISFEDAMGLIIGIAGIAFGALQLIKYFRAADSKNIVVLIVGAILILAGILVLALPDTTSAIFVFVQAIIAVWAGANGIIWLMRSFKNKSNTNPTVFIARLVLCLVMLAFAITLLILAFAGDTTILVADRVIIGCAVTVYGLAQLFMLD